MMNRPIALLAAALSLAAPLRAQDDEARVEAWAEDLFTLVERFDEMHPDAWHAIPREEFDVAVDELYGRLPELDDDQALVELMRLFALHSRAGKEGHCGVYPPARTGALPVSFYRFSDGWFVVSAEREDLVGARLVAVEDTPVEDAARALAPLFTHDCPINLLGKEAAGLSMGRLLAGLGIAESADEVGMTFERDGERTTVRLEARSPWTLRAVLPPDPGALGRSNPDAAWWRRVLPERDALYVQYNRVARASETGESLATFAQETVEEFEASGLGRIVLDVRSNGGGDNTTFGPLVAALAGSSANRPGGLYVLIGRGTFSAAGNFAAAIMERTEAILVGEPTGGAPNQFGDARRVELPNHRDLTVLVSTRYHEFLPGVERLTTEPHLPVGVSSADWLADRDPVLETALTHEP